MSRRSSKNNVMAGIFVLVSLAGAVFVIILLSNLRQTFESTTGYVVRFSLTQGTAGLTDGAAVNLGGQPVGRVSGIGFAQDASTGLPSGVDVHIQILKRIQLYPDADVQLVQQLLGSNSELNIAGLGHTGPGVNPLPAGAQLNGRLAPPSFLAQAGYGPEQQDDLRTILTNLRKTSDWISSYKGELAANIEDTRGRLNDALDNVRDVSSDLKKSWPGLRDKADSILTKVDDGVGPLMDKSRAGIEDVRRVASKAETVIDENRDDIRSTVKNIESVSSKLNGPVYDQFQQVLTRASGALDQFTDAASQATKLIRTNSPELGLMIANARLASDQLKATAIEVRAAPWRLLYQPGKKEFENEILYDSVRTYAEAVSDLRATAATLQQVQAAGGEPQEGEGRTVKQVVEDLKSSFERYQKAEQEFLSQWVGTNKRAQGN